MGKFRCVAISLAMIAGMFLNLAEAATPAGGELSHPRPSGYQTEVVPQTPSSLSFTAPEALAGHDYDLVAEFPQHSMEKFTVERVTVNGEPRADFVVANAGVFNGNNLVHGSQKFTVSTYADWRAGTIYEVVVEGKSSAGEQVRVAASAKSPDTTAPVKSVSFRTPSAEFPFHQAIMTLGKKGLAPGRVTRVEVDGAWNRDARFFNTGRTLPGKSGEAPEGESYEGIIHGGRDFQIVAPVTWANGSRHTMRVVVEGEGGEERVYEGSGVAPGSGGHWNAAWPHYVSYVLRENVGLERKGEPVHITVGLFADEVSDPRKEIRVVTYDPTHPKAGDDGYVIAPAQVLNVTTWRDEQLLNHEELDAETGEPVHRYDATTTVDLLFYADVAPYEERVFQILFGNPEAEGLELSTAMSIEKGEGLSQTVANDFYSFYLSENSGAVETVTVKGGSEPVLLEHKLETNGAVHWNPGFYSPPTPWVHASDWETPIYDEINGPLMLRTRRFAPLPHMDSVNASISYEFYANQPYVVMTSFMEVLKDQFVMALRNGELVFNHATLDEFVWEDPRGKVQSQLVSEAEDASEKHPIHAKEVPADTPWMAFISRDAGVGFAHITLAFENGNRFGQPASETQPYFYVQNGPWIYWSRPIVYPFGGMNFTRMMPVRAGSVYFEKNAWVPFRLIEGNDPFADVKRIQKLLNNPLDIQEFMPTNERTPPAWVMPILTMPFDEGVAGAVSAHKDTEEDQEGDKQ
ncbi:MAG: hypothetical protein KJ052_05170 [Candidatus Hydrogenedentes bacterium]|nr:hypothetical protein [Candidatus Hydrogenedentota bacterium]